MRTLVLLVSAFAISLGAGCTSYRQIPRYEAPAAEAMGSTADSLPPLYRIDYEDVLSIKSLYHEELTGPAAVRPDGQITVPALGDFYAVGLTPDELEADIVRRASITHRNPVISVIVKEYTTYRAYIGGSVRSPGYVKVTSDLTTLRAIVERGGFTPRARLDSVIHVAWSDTGNYTAQRIDLERVLETGRTEQDVFLGPNDIVYIPSTWIADAGTFTQQILEVVPIREPTTRFPTFE